MFEKTILFRGNDFILKSLDHVNIEDAYNFKPTKDWFEKLEKEQNLHLDDLEFRDIFYIDNQVRFVSLICKIRDHELSFDEYIKQYNSYKNYYMPGYVFLTGDKFSLLPVLSCEENNNLYTIVLEQTRLPIVDIKKIEITTGHLLDNNVLSESSTLNKIKEILKIKNFNNHNLIDLGSMSWSGKSKWTTCCSLIDENIISYAFHKKVKLSWIDKINQQKNNDKIKVKVIFLDDLWGYSRDSKTLAAYCLYQNLVKYKCIDKKLNKLRPQYPCSCLIS
tara:strand:- start:2924 stop:3754 length:831 start_codon:yes stop_codon:yes gene_type:complete